MPVLDFTLESKIAWIVDPCRDGEGQTIRPARKHPIKLGDRLYLYAHQRTKNCRKLGEAVCSEVVKIIMAVGPKNASDLFVRKKGFAELFWFFSETDQLAEDDGFEDYFSFRKFFIKTYKLKPGDSKEMEIIKWKDFVSEIK